MTETTGYEDWAERTAEARAEAWMYVSRWEEDAAEDRYERRHYA